MGVANSVGGLIGVVNAGALPIGVTNSFESEMAGAGSTKLTWKSSRGTKNRRSGIPLAGQVIH